MAQRPGITGADDAASVNDALYQPAAPQSQLSLLNAGAAAPAAEAAINAARNPQEEDRNNHPFHLAKLAAQAMLFSAFQQPLNALAQVGNHAAEAVGIGDGHVMSAPHFMDAPQPQRFGTLGWAAETIGSGAGMIAPFMVADAMVGKAGSLLKGTRVAELAESLPLSARLQPIARPVASGMVFGALFTPSDDDDFLAGRLKNAAVSGVTFGAQRAATLGVMGALKPYGMPFEAPGAAGLWSRVGANAAGGGVAGLVNANAESLLGSEHRLATAQENAQSALSFIVTGGALDLANAGAGKAGELHARFRDYMATRRAGSGATADATAGGAALSTDTAGTTETVDTSANRKAGGGSGSMGKVQERLTEGSEAEREATGKQQHAAPVLAAQKALAETLRTKYGVDETSASGQQLNSLIERTMQREFRTLEMNPAEIADTLAAVNRFLKSDDMAVNLTAEQKLQTAAQLLRESAEVPDPVQADQMENRVLAIMQTMQYKYPGRMAELIGQLLTGGRARAQGRYPIEIELTQETLSKLPPEFRQTLSPSPQAAVTLSRALEPGADPTAGGKLTYTQELMHLIGMNALAQDSLGQSDRTIFAVNRATNDHALFQLQPDGNYMRTLNQVPIDTPELQNVFERLTGTEKGAYVLKNGSPFVLVEPDGTYKLFADDTQYLGYGWRVNGRGLESIKAEMTGAFEGTMIGANRTALGLDARSVHLTQESVIYDGALHQRVTVANTTDHPINLSLAQVVSHDFPDMFEVRGWDRKVRGEDLPPRVNTATHSIRYSYKGRDGAIMSTDVHVSGVKPSTIAPDQLTWTLSLAPGEARNIEVVAKPGLNAEPIDWSQQPASDTLAMREKAIAQYQAWRNQQATIETDNPVLNKLIEQTYKDIYSLRISTPKGDAIAAGLPWFASLFGRDDLLTSLQVLPYMPDLCKDVLRTLAAYQGTKEVAETGEKPGKILHELRVGEMARAGEIPFAPSYHTVDATPLFLMLLGRYVQASGDTAFEREMRPTVDNIVKYLDSEVERGKGYLIYGGRGAEVLSNQGWKDSGDSILYSTGELAKPPIALSEVQGYLYDGWHQAAKLYERQGDIQKAAELRQKAAQLRERFRNDYWMPERNFIALALDGNGKQANVISSNPGHLLMTGILSESEARAVAAGLMERNMFSGWGDRTLESETARYFANSYHNGSVWPHDNSIIAMGMHHWAPQDSAKLMWSMFEAAQHLPTLRLPELFAGYPREQTGVPIPYPVACEPQAWSAVAIPSMLASSLGMHVDGLNGKLTFYNPYMPDQLSTVTFRNIRVGTNKVDVRVDRGPDGKVQLNVLDNPGNVPVYIEQPS